MRAYYHRILAAYRSEVGSVFVLVALAAIMLIAATGVAVDMARAQILQGRIQTALDAAGLAAGATAVTPPSPMPGFCGSSSWVQCEAQKYFSANFPTGYLGSNTVTLVATLGDPTNNNCLSSQMVCLSAATTQDTTFLQVIGIKTVAVGASTQITRANQGMELVLVLDNTGSMQSAVNPSNSNTSKIVALQDAITSSGGLLDILYGGDQTVPNMWIGVVPFTYMVNLGSAHSGWLDTAADASLDYGPNITGSGSRATCPPSGTTSGSAAGNGSTRCSYSILTSQTQPNFGMTNWGGCIDARSATTNSYADSGLKLDESDDIPSSSNSGTYFPAFYYPTTSGTASSSNTCSGSNSGYTNAWSCSRTTGSGSNTARVTTYYQEDSADGGNSGCIQAPILGMVAERDTISNEVAGMTAAGGTMINLGMAWGWRMLSPAWQGLWGGEMDSTGNTQFPVLPLPYRTVLMNKVVVLMTDGQNDVSGLPVFGSAYENQTMPTDSQLDTKTEAICDAMKANGVIIYTIGFGTTDNPANSGSSTYVNGTLLKYCSTQNYSGDTSHYFLAPTNTQLAAAFQQIGAALANLRVSQ